MTGQEKFLRAIQTGLLAGEGATPQWAARRMLQAIQLSENCAFEGMTYATLLNDISDFLRWSTQQDYPLWIVNKIGFPD